MVKDSNTSRTLYPRAVNYESKSGRRIRSHMPPTKGTCENPIRLWRVSTGSEKRVMTEPNFSTPFNPVCHMRSSSVYSVTDSEIDEYAEKTLPPIPEHHCRSGRTSALSSPPPSQDGSCIYIGLDTRPRTPWRGEGENTWERTRTPPNWPLVTPSAHKVGELHTTARESLQESPAPPPLFSQTIKQKFGDGRSKAKKTEDADPVVRVEKKKEELATLKRKIQEVTTKLKILRLLDGDSLSDPSPKSRLLTAPSFHVAHHPGYSSAVSAKANMSSVSMITVERPEDDVLTRDDCSTLPPTILRIPRLRGHSHSYSGVTETSTVPTFVEANVASKVPYTASKRYSQGIKMIKMRNNGHTRFQSLRPSTGLPGSHETSASSTWSIAEEEIDSWQAEGHVEDYSSVRFRAPWSEPTLPTKATSVASAQKFKFYPDVSPLTPWQACNPPRRLEEQFVHDLSDAQWAEDFPETVGSATSAQAIQDASSTHDISGVHNLYRKARASLPLVKVGLRKSSRTNSPFKARLRKWLSNATFGGKHPKRITSEPLDVESRFEQISRPPQIPKRSSSGFRLEQAIFQELCATHPSRRNSRRGRPQSSARPPCPRSRTTYGNYSSSPQSVLLHHVRETSIAFTSSNSSSTPHSARYRAVSTGDLAPIPVSTIGRVHNIPHYRRPRQSRTSTTSTVRFSFGSAPSLKLASFF